MLNLSLKELRLIAKNRNINGYESIPKDRLVKISNNNKGDRKSLLKPKKEEAKKAFISQQRIVFLIQKKKKPKPVFTRQHKRRTQKSLYKLTRKKKS